MFLYPVVSTAFGPPMLFWLCSLWLVVVVTLLLGVERQLSQFHPNLRGLGSPPDHHLCLKRCLLPKRWFLPTRVDMPGLLGIVQCLVPHLHPLSQLLRWHWFPILVHLRVLLPQRHLVSCSVSSSCAFIIPMLDGTVKVRTFKPVPPLYNFPLFRWHVCLLCELLCSMHGFSWLG